MSGIDLVASFNAEFLVADKYLQNQPPDRSEETQRDVEEGTATLAVSEKGERDLVAWVARKWQAQLDTWWMYGEPVFWCEHIRPDDDEQPSWSGSCAFLARWPATSALTAFVLPCSPGRAPRSAAHAARRRPKPFLAEPQA